VDNDGYVHYKVDFNENLSDDESNSWCDEAEIEESSEEEEGEGEIEENYYDEEDSPVKRKKKKKKKKKKAKTELETTEKTEGDAETIKKEELELVE